jgi:hypothetical protein
LGSAFFFRRLLILSSLSHEFTTLCLLYESLAKEQFVSFPLWLSPAIAGTGESTIFVPMTLSVIASGELLIFVLIDRQDAIESVLDDVTKLLSNGISDFSRDCAAFGEPPKTTAGGIIALWPDTGIVKSLQCPIPVLQRMSEEHDAFEAHPMVQEIVTSDGQTQVTGIRLIDVEVFVQAESKGSFLSMLDTYAKVRAFLPNLPPDLQKL